MGVLGVFDTRLVGVCHLANGPLVVLRYERLFLLIIFDAEYV